MLKPWFGLFGFMGLRVERVSGVSRVDIEDIVFGRRALRLFGLLYWTHET